MEQRRGSNAIGIIGTNNTGKTAVCKRVIEKINKKRDYFKSTGKKYPSNYHKILVFDPQEQFSEYLREGDIEIMSNTKNWEDMILGLRDSTIIFDDFKLLNDGDTISEGLKAIFAWGAAYGLDLIFILWHPLDLPPKVARVLDKYYLFRITGDEKEIVSRLNGSKPDLINNIRLLDKEFLKYNEMQYKALYPNFPFIFYDTGTNKSVKVNFKK